MKIADLALRSSLPLEYRKSYMRVDALVWYARGPRPTCLRIQVAVTQPSPPALEK